jgi:electron transfer flavoprotein alpha subunit
VIKVLIVAEHDGLSLNAATARCVSCAVSLRPAVLDIIVFGEECQPIAEQAAALAGVSRVIWVEMPAAERTLAAVLAPELAVRASHYSHVLGPSTTFGKDLMPRLAALIGVGQLSDIMAVLGPYEFQRPIYAGNALIRVRAPDDRVLVATVRAASYEAAGPGGSAQIEKQLRSVPATTHTRFIELKRAQRDRPDLQAAARVVSGGRGVGSAENFALLVELAERLGAAVGASRAAVDSGFAPNDLQVGQTGKIIAPELYIAVGISGAIQHLTGIKDARTIVAINRDSEAPIFEIADFGLVADLFEAVPALTALLPAN